MNPADGGIEAMEVKASCKLLFFILLAYIRPWQIEEIPLSAVADPISRPHRATPS
jgi:hypothetical protein